MSKQKEDKKPKKTIKQVFTSLNTTKSIEHGNVVVNPKDKRVKWFFGIGLTLVLATGIAIPWAMAAQVSDSQKGRPDDAPIISPIIPGGDLNFGDIENILNPLQVQRSEAIIKEFQDFSTQYWYVKERAAFQQFKVFLENTKFKNEPNKTIGNNEFGFDVSKPLSEVKNSAIKELNDDRQKFINSNPGDWEKKWLNELLTNEKYGKPLGEAQANAQENVAFVESKVINYLTSSKIKEIAFATYNSAEINTTAWTKADLSLTNNTMLNYDLITPSIKLDTNKKTWAIEEVIEAGKGTINTNHSNYSWEKFLGENNDNIFFEAGISNKDNIAVYQTKSYILENRNPIKNFKDIYTQTYKSANISKIDLPFSLKDNVWNFTQELLVKLLTIYEYRDATGSVKYGMPIIDIVNFKGAGNFLQDTTSVEFKKDIISKVNSEIAMIEILNTSSTPPDGGEGDGSTKSQNSLDNKSSTKEGESTTTASSLGSSGVKKISELLKSSENSDRFFNLVALSSGEYASSNFKGENFTTTKNPALLFQAKKLNPFNQILASILDVDLNDESVPQGVRDIKELLSTNITFKNNDLEIDWDKSLQANTDSNSDFNAKGNYKEFNDLLSSITFLNDNFNIFFNSRKGVIPKIFKDTNESSKFTTDKSTHQRKWTVYELSPQTFMYIDNNGTKIYNINKANEKNMNNMLKTSISSSYFKGKSSLPAGSYEWFKTDFFDVSNLYSSINNDNLINLINYSMFNFDDTNDEYSQNWKQILTWKIKDDETFDDLNLIVKTKMKTMTSTAISKENSDALVDIYKLVQDNINLNDSYDFYLDKDFNYIFNNGQNYESIYGSWDNLASELQNKINFILNIDEKLNGGK
ncbi:MAG: hypothetical protein ACRCRZ_01060 [Metamycoplasmataceae bacterium]